MSDNIPLKQGRLIFQLDEVPNTRKKVEGETGYSSNATVKVFYEGFSKENEDAEADAQYLLDRVIYQALMTDKNPLMKRWEGKL